MIERIERGDSAQALSLAGSHRIYRDPDPDRDHDPDPDRDRDPDRDHDHDPDRDHDHDHDRDHDQSKLVRRIDAVIFARPAIRR